MRDEPADKRLCECNSCTALFYAAAAAVAATAFYMHVAIWIGRQKLKVALHGKGFLQETKNIRICSCRLVDRATHHLLLSEANSK
jgi:hypothetical protein